jgi:hypothetical protein
MKNFPRYISRVSVTRPANTTAYDAFDVVDSASTGVIEFPNISVTGGGAIVILYASLMVNVDAIPAGMGSFKLHLYSSAPTAIADNDPYNLPSDDRTKYLGAITLGTPADLGATLFIEDDNVRKFVVTSGSSLFAIAQTVAGFTPSSGAVKTWSLAAAEA